MRVKEKFNTRLLPPGPETQPKCNSSRPRQSTLPTNARSPGQPAADVKERGRGGGGTRGDSLKAGKPGALEPGRKVQGEAPAPPSRC